METIIEQNGKKLKITDGYNLYGSKEDLLLLYGALKSKQTEIDNIPDGELGCITVGSINIKPDKLGEVVEWKGK